MALREQVMQEMKTFFGEDARRIDHALAVLGHAEALVAGRLADAPALDADVVVAAAILHDVGIPAAERKHGSAAGHWQELEGPPIARELLRGTALSPAQIDHVCAIVANHHSARDIDTEEFRIVYDADWLVNLPVDGLTRRPDLAAFIDKTLKTPAGRKRAADLFIRKGTNP